MDDEISKLAVQALIGKIEQARDLIDDLVQHHEDLQASEHLSALFEAIEELKDSLADLERADDAYSKQLEVPSLSIVKLDTGHVEVRTDADNDK